MRAYIFGNGASVACKQHTGSDFLIWGLAEAKKILNGNSNVSNARWSIRSGLEMLINILDETRNQYNESSRGLYWPELLQEYKQYIHNQLNDDLMIKSKLEDLFRMSNFSAIVEKVVEIALDSSSGNYCNAAQKRAKLLGPHSGNFLDNLEDLQRDLTGLASHNVVFPNHYDEFVKLLDCESEALIINLNWDALFENAYRRVTEREPKHIFLPNSLLVRNRTTYGKHNLSKPHGSLEYLCCQSPAHATVNGCFRITVLPGAWYYPVNANADMKCIHECGYGSNLKPFLLPYARVTRSKRASPFVAASLEALKPYLSRVKEIVSIGYSFATDANGWIDEDLFPIFVGKRIHLIDQSISEATKNAEGIRKNIGFSQVAPMDVSGFSGYIDESKKANGLLP